MIVRIRHIDDSVSIDGNPVRGIKLGGSPDALRKSCGRSCESCHRSRRRI